MHFIRLTQYENFRRVRRPCIVNMALVTQMHSQELKLATKTSPVIVDGRVDYTQPSITTHPAETLTLTTISFCAGMNEEVDAIWVTETLEQIMSLIPEQA